MPAKADKLTVERRVEAVYRLILDGWTTEQILHNTADWPVNQRQREYYIAAANARIEATAAPIRAEHHRRAVAAHYQLLREAKTVREKLAVWQALAKLIGLNAPDELVVTWRDEVIDLLRSGAITPDVVEAELGDELARELFNAAGVSRA
jgi:hypothetical protein